MSTKTSQQSSKKQNKTTKATNNHRDIWHRIGRWLLIITGVILLLSLLVYTAFQVSPWPKALLIRQAFDKGGDRMSTALEKYVPSGVATSDTLQYRQGDSDAQLQAFYPQSAAQSDKKLPTIVWIHGGAWISGSTHTTANYLKIIASHGYTVIGIDYSLAPGKQYPTPIVQGNAALRYIQQNAQKLHADTSQIVLAGDSAGSQIAAQIAALTTEPSYAKEIAIAPTLSADKLKAVVLNCGAYDLSLADYNGPSGDFLRTVLWSYSGTKHFLTDPKLKLASVANYVDKNYPPAFITAGNIDPLEAQSREMAKNLALQGVPVDTLFYAENHQPKLPHEYQFNLDNADGKEALSRILAFLQKYTVTP